MANSASARKRIGQNERNRVRNRARKSVVKSSTRKLLDAIHNGELDKAREALPGVQKLLDQVAAKGTLHRNTAARRKSRLARRLNAAVASARSG
ncbi:MAG: 30S ribosomal protein S20 [Phycisphaerae bacterium]